MKKRFVLLSAALLFALRSVAFATEVPPPQITGSEIYVAAPDSVPKRVEHQSGQLVDGVAPNSILYFVIEHAKRADDFAGLRAFADEFERGREFVLAPTIEYRMMYEADGEQAGYRYVAALPVLDLAGAERANVNGKITVAKRWFNSKKFKFGFIIRKSGAVSVSTYLCEPNSFVIDFPKKTGMVSLVFEEKARFDVDAAGQGNIDVGFRTDEITDVRLRYPNERLRFLTWSKSPVFNREGTLYITAEKGQFLYEITPAGLRPITEFDSEGLWFVQHTRRLSSYVLSNRALDPDAEPIAWPNPLTGADF